MKWDCTSCEYRPNSSGFILFLFSFFRLLLSGKNKLKAMYLFIHRCCSRFTYPGAWFSVSNCNHYKMCLY